MATDRNQKPMAIMQVMAYVDGNIQATLDLEPAANNMPVIDAMYAFLDDFIGLNHDTPDDGGSGEPLDVTPVLTGDTPTKGAA